MFGFIEFHVNAKDLGQARFGEDLIPSGIHDLPLGNEVHVFRGSLNDLIGSRLSVQREQTLAHFSRRKDGRVLIRFLSKSKESHNKLLLRVFWTCLLFGGMSILQMNYTIENAGEGKLARVRYAERIKSNTGGRSILVVIGHWDPGILNQSELPHLRPIRNDLIFVIDGLGAGYPGDLDLVINRWKKNFCVRSVFI